MQTVIFIFLLSHFHFRLAKMSHRVDIDSKSTVDYPKVKFEKNAEKIP